MYDLTNDVSCTKLIDGCVYVNERNVISLCCSSLDIECKRIDIWILIILNPCSAHADCIRTDRSLLMGHNALLLRHIATCRDILHALLHRRNMQIASELSNQAECSWGEPPTY